jgi:hypothetical protein
MTHNSDGADIVGIRHGAADPGGVQRHQRHDGPADGTITAGQAMSTFTSNSGNSGTACATVDNQLVCTPSQSSSRLTFRHQDRWRYLGRRGGMLTYTIMAAMRDRAAPRPVW